MNKVSLVLGTMTFGESVFHPDVEQFVSAFLEAGYTELDTAYVYNNGDCECLLGDFLPSLERTFTIASKANPRITGRLDYDAVKNQVNESLERLHLPYVDIEYLHFPDPFTPVEGALRAMNELHEEGKVKEFGLSNFPAWMVADVWNICDRNNWIKPGVYEGIYNPLTRKAETELNACLNHFGMRFYAYNPLAGGLLTGRYQDFEETPSDGRFTHRPNYQGRYWKKSYFDSVKLIKDAAEKEGMTIIEAVYRWLSYHSMLSGDRHDAIIIGASKLNHLKQNLETVRKGPLPESLLDAFEQAWQMSKSDSPEYFTLFKGNN